MRNMLDKTNQKLKNIERKNNKGFTLVELIIVIAIIAVLAAVLAPQYVKYIERSRQGVDANTLSEIKHNVEVQAGLIENPKASTVTISTAGAISGTEDFAADSTNLKAVTDVIGTTVEFKSKAAGGNSYVIEITAEGKVTWATDSDKVVKELQAGTAKAAAAAPEGGE